MRGERKRKYAFVRECGPLQQGKAEREQASETCVQGFPEQVLPLLFVKNFNKQDFSVLCMNELILNIIEHK